MVRRQKQRRPGHRWVRWSEGPLEGRQLMSTLPQVAMAEVGATMPGRSIAATHRRLGVSRDTYLEVVNNTDILTRLEISGVDNYDWDGNSRPDHNLDGVVLEPGRFTVQREEINLYARRPAFVIAFCSVTTGQWIVKARVAWIDPGLWTITQKEFNPKFRDLLGNVKYEVIALKPVPWGMDTLYFEPRSLPSDRSGAVRSPHRPLVKLSQATYLTIRNQSPYSIRLGVSAVDNHDWDGNSRPDHNLQGVVLQPGTSVTRREEVNYGMIPAFDLSLYNADTGAFIGTSRAVGQMYRPSLWKGVYTWELSPTTQMFDNGGVSVTFGSRDHTLVPDNSGTFIVA
ncbi:MAG: hypothetical protein ACYC61_33500 [Isosphaeraceae bacterium]